MTGPSTVVQGSADAMHPGSPQTCTQRVAVIGSGYWGKNLVRNFSSLGALAAVCDVDAETLQQLNQQYPTCRMVSTYSEVLNDPSIHAVAIATPAETHAHLALDALSAGKDVFVEKPLCLSEAEAHSLVTFARENKRILMVGHLLWYHPAVLKLKELIDSGELGRIQYIYSFLCQIEREAPSLNGGAPLHLI